MVHRTDPKNTLKEVLYSMGLSDMDISNATGISENSVRSWREREELAEHRPEPQEEPTTEQLVNGLLMMMQFYQNQMQDITRQMNACVHSVDALMNDEFMSWGALSANSTEKRDLVPAFARQLMVYRGLRKATNETDGEGRSRAKVHEYADLPDDKEWVEAVGDILETFRKLGVAERNGRRWRLSGSEQRI